MGVVNHFRPTPRPSFPLQIPSELFGADGERSAVVVTSRVSYATDFVWETLIPRAPPIADFGGPPTDRSCLLWTAPPSHTTLLDPLRGAEVVVATTSTPTPPPPADRPRVTLSRPLGGLTAGPPPHRKPAACDPVRVSPEHRTPNRAPLRSFCRKGREGGGRTPRSGRPLRIRTSPTAGDPVADAPGGRNARGPLEPQARPPPTPSTTGTGPVKSMGEVN